ncbi:MAG: molybdopterin-dependent oxidoreductase [Gemmatimonadetes bacterium]|nr:molybdopterin-dependent oxidoreductase [Gemmatimonadota bacterium]
MATVHATSCPLDCPDTCSLDVTVEEGRVAKIAAGNGHPATSGFICSKLARFDRRLYHPDRLLYPMRRVGAKGEGRFDRISWGEAIATITGRFKQIVEQWGGEAVLPYNYGGSNGMLTDGFIDALFFARLGASRLQKTLCAAPTTAVATAMYGKMPGVAFEDYPMAQSIIVWGANPKASSIHFVPHLREAKRRGAFIAIVDPRRNFSQREVDLHLPVRPGTDLPLALGLIKLWHDAGQLDRGFLDRHAKGLEPLLRRAEEWSLDRVAEVTGVPHEDITLLAGRFAGAAPAVIRCGWGLERNRNGGQAVAAVLAIPALLGKFGVRGGGYTLSNSGAVRSRMAEGLGTVPPDTRLINMSELGMVLNEHTMRNAPVKGLFVYNCNPVATAPDQNAVIEGLRRDDLFTVVFEQVYTDTTKYADILLPATTFLEHADVRVSYGSYVVAGVTPVVDPEGEARSNPDVFAELGRAMGWDDQAFHWDAESYVHRAAAHLRLPGGNADADVLNAGGVQPVAFPDATPVQFETVSPQTPDGLVDLTPAVLGDDPYGYLPPENTRYPLALISPANTKMISSTLGEFNYEELVVTMHPEDAGPRNLADGDQVKVYNELGEVVCLVEVRTMVRPGVVSMPKGAWVKSSRNGSTSTALCPASVNVVAGGACYNDARVEVVRSG